MSITQFIMDRPIIVVLLIASLIPLFIAVTLVLRLVFRSVAARREQLRKLAPNVDLEGAIDNITDFVDEADVPDNIVPFDPNQSLAGKPAAGTVPAEDEEEEESSEGENNDQPESGMQDLLNSVFTEEERVDRYGKLLEDVEPVPAKDILNLAEIIAQRLKQAKG